MKSLELFWRSFETGVRKNRLTHRAAAFAALVIESAVSLLLYLCRVRFLQLNSPGRVGHLVGDVARFVKERTLGSAPWHYGVLLSPPGVAANERLLDYWRRYIVVVRSPFWARILFRLTRFRYLVRDVGTLALDETAPYIAVERKWGERPPLLELAETDRRRGREWLAAIGMPAGARFVCFHSRESGYDEDARHAFRNSSIENYLPAVTELVRRGFWCMRMGDPSMRPIPRMENVVDYAHLDSRSDWLDVFLSAECHFFLGSCSGLLTLANVFGRPCAVANQAPMSHAYSFSVHDIAIPKLVWSERDRRMLGFAEVMHSDIANLRYTNLYEERGVRPVESAAEDIRDLALEMLDRIDGRAAYTQEDEALQQRFRALFRPGHYSYGGVNRVGREFLRKYRRLLGDPPALC